ncbi:MAG TPA: ribonuclease Y [Ignavibacteriaceae bacterium]|nr:ribonuclease Y [Ignavibacteriaceae bacterium]
MQLDILLLIPMVIILVSLFFFLGWKFNSKVGKKSLLSAEERGKLIIADAQKESNNIKREKLLEVKDEWYKKKVEFDAEVNQKRQKISVLEKQLITREENIEKKFDLVIKKERENKLFEKELQDLKKNIDNRFIEIQKLEAEQNEKLEKISGLTSDEAKRMLIDNLVNQAKADSNILIKEIHDKAKSDAKRDAQKIIVQAIQRTAADHSIETTVSVVQIQNDEMKGRIIGKEGRNIRSFEAATGVDVIVDDTPEAVILSSFDQFRREVARVSLERLILDGRIHPARIEEVVEKVRVELEEEMFREGENTVLQLGLHNMHPELIKHIGKMRYRSSYGQNLLQHSVEVAYLTGIMAAEVGLDSTMAKRAGLLHDVGKTIDKNAEGPHALLGYELTKKYKEPPIVINAVGSHHEDMAMEHPIAPLVQAADAISGARPGARREPLEGYVKRLETLEALAKSFEGVAKTYAIQAGREIRVVVEHDKIDDIVADKLSHDIASKIEGEMDYPGQIKVTVIREVRKISFAR